MGSEIWTNGRHLFKNHLKSGQKSPDLELSGFQMVGTVAIAEAKALPKKLKPDPLNPRIFDIRF